MHPKEATLDITKPIPQDRNLEEAVVGAVILQQDAIGKILYLRQHHFFHEDLRLTYNACISMHAEGQPIDMKLLVHHLRESGSLEQVGGVGAIVEWTSKVSTAHNIEQHARVLMQLSAKREMIRLSASLQKEAYDEGSDISELFDRYIDDFAILRDRTFQMPKDQQIKLTWPTILINEKPKEVPPIIRIGLTPIATPGNHSLLVGKKKSRKSLGVTLMMNFLFEQAPIRPEEVALFDTEQGELRAWKYMDRIRRLTGHKINVFNLRGKGYKERKDIIEQTVLHWPHKLKFIVIDGIRDLVADINDAVECTEIIT